MLDCMNPCINVNKLICLQNNRTLITYQINRRLKICKFILLKNINMKRKLSIKLLYNKYTSFIYILKAFAFERLVLKL